MTGYRRVEPAFCRGCGAPWTPGATACPSCGEALLREAAPTGDPRAVPRLRAVLITSALLLAARWGALVAVPLIILSASDLGWLFAAIGASVLAVLTARWWYPGSLPSSLWARGRPSAWMIAVVAGVGLPLALASSLGIDQFTVPVFFGEALVLLGDLDAQWIAVLVVMIVAEEAMFRGLLFDGVASLGNARNAAIASTIVFAILSLDAAYAVLGAVAALLRLKSGSVWPGVVLRLVAGATWLALISEGFGS